MNNSLIYTGLFVGQVIILFFVSKVTIQELFYFFRIFFRREQVVFSLISFLFLPGTILHEMAHFLMATILLLRVGEIKIFPVWEKNYIRLGHVLYEKKDVIRGILVGIAPVIAGLLFFWGLGVSHLFPSTNIWLNVLLGYLIFVVSSTMFSSKQDMVDIIFILPVLVFVGLGLYIFQFDFSQLLRADNVFVIRFNEFLYGINFYILLSLFIHGIVIGVIKVVRLKFH
ncbi:hypothetical protein HGB07_01430 [Candidatus Roizmanbacteria bacterium]|nr:hypothetical protein [Candidatus Roizmanbacteria bacterium]